MHQQWARFLVVNLGGFVLNRGTYALLVTFVPLCAEQPVFAVAAGAIVGMFLNFGLAPRRSYSADPAGHHQPAQRLQAMQCEGRR